MSQGYCSVHTNSIKGFNQVVMGSKASVDISRGVIFPVHLESPDDRVRAFMRDYDDSDGYSVCPHPLRRSEVLTNNLQGFDSAIMRDLNFISATVTPKATAKFELTIVPSICNRMNNLHGGAAALILDMCTTMAVAPLSRHDFWLFGGVSRLLSVTFLRPASVGTLITIECEVIQIGKQLGKVQSA